jgi:hypothetical protein
MIESSKRSPSIPLRKGEEDNIYSPYAERRSALIPQPLLPQEKGSKISIIFLFPSPAGEGLGVRAEVN